MNKIIEIIRAPKNIRGSYPKGSLFTVKIHSETEGDFEAYLTPNEYKLRLLKEKLYYEYNVPDEFIEKVIEIAKNIAEDDYIYNNSEDI